MGSCGCLFAWLQRQSSGAGLQLSLVVLVQVLVLLRVLVLVLGLGKQDIWGKVGKVLGSLLWYRTDTVDRRQGKEVVLGMEQHTAVVADKVEVLGK